MNPNLLISVVVTTYNRSRSLIPVLLALQRQTDTFFEIVIADDGSTPDHQKATRESLGSLTVGLKHVWHPDIGFTASRVRNRGVSVASGDYIVFLDGDCLPEVDFVAQHRRLMESGCMVNGSRVLLSKQFTNCVESAQCNPIDRSFWYWLQRKALGDASKLTARLRLPDFALRRTPGFRWSGIRSCNMGVWRSDFEAANGFDESFVGWGHEDADFVLRLHNNGVVRKNGFWATEVYHLWHPESSRSREGKNAQTVRDRMVSKVVLPESGYAQSKGGSDMVVSVWN
jgi:glycosyltransferase involved in cell wall biosynthesis